MKAYLPSNPSLKKETPLKTDLQPSPASFPPKQINTPIIVKQDSFSDSGSGHKQKASMEHLCLLFLERIAPREEGKFEAKDLLDDSGIKKRRIYDLMNILEGCGFVRRISKGAYFWKGFKPLETTRPNRGRKKESTSLSTLAYQIKTALFASQDPIDFKDIVKKILDENDETNLNPDSVKRRIYECCKVLKVLGIVEKKQHAFSWIRNKQIRTVVKPSKQSSTSKSKRKVDSTQKTLQFKQREENCQLTARIIDTINTEDELNTFIRNLRAAFLRKLQQNVGIKRQLKYE